jgi:3-deoxy-D-manno-octulosonic acid kinase
MGDLLRAGEAPDWAAIGRTIARFHRAGACHADLNVDNVLMDADGSHWLIDFDRGRLRQSARAWQLANLARLLRSLRKQLGARAHAAEIVEGWQALRNAYDAGVRETA